MRYYALVPCAGSGSRSGRASPKQYAIVAGRSLVAHTLDALAGVSRLDAIMVVVSPGDAGFRDAAPGFDGLLESVGGPTRAQTVANGLQALKRHGAADEDWVLVHDAARCLVRPEWVDALIDSCADDPVGGILAWPAADTLKQQLPAPRAAASHETADQGDAPARIANTLDRRGVWQAQTPQMFRLGLLQRALAPAGGEHSHITDEASAVEALGLAPRLVVGAFENFKLTYPPDFDMAERLLATRGASSNEARARKP